LTLEFGGWAAVVEELPAGELFGVFCTEAPGFGDGSLWLHPLDAMAKSRAVTSHAASTSRLCNGVRFTHSWKTESNSIVIPHTDGKVGSISCETYRASSPGACSRGIFGETAISGPVVVNESGNEPTP
jgi:hypothetical protein